MFNVVVCFVLKHVLYLVLEILVGGVGGGGANLHTIIHCFAQM